MSTTDKHPCPHCGVEMDHVQKMSGEWWECENTKCPYLDGQEARTYTIRGVVFEDEYPLPYSTGFKHY